MWRWRWRRRCSGDSGAYSIGARIELVQEALVPRIDATVEDPLYRVQEPVSALARLCWQ